MTRHKRNYSWPQECDVQIVYPAHILCKITVPQKDAKRKHIFTRRGSEIRITDSAETLAYVFGYINMKKAAILDPNAQKN